MHVHAPHLGPLPAQAPDQIALALGQAARHVLGVEAGVLLVVPVDASHPISGHVALDQAANHTLVSEQIPVDSILLHA